MIATDLITKVFGTMDTIKQIELFLKFAGAALVGSEILAYNLKNKTRNKLANGKLISKNDILDILGDDGLILSKDIQLKEKFDFEGSVILGPTGSKKSTSIPIPNLLSNKLKGSIIVTDPKEEIFTITSGYQKNVCGRRVLKFSPLDPTNSEKYNLLENCKDNTEVLELAESLLINGSLSIELSTGKKTGGIEWVQMCIPLLSAALLYCKDLEYPYNNIEFAFKLLITLKNKELDSLFGNSKNFDCVDQWNIFKMVQGADRTEGSIKISLSTNLKIFTDQRINAVNNTSTFNFEDFRKEPTILYLTYPENKANYISPYTAPFFTKMLDTFIDEYNKNSLKVHCLFDEFTNIGMIANMNTKASTVRSREISLNICIQGLTQLYQTYGKEIGDTILNNLKTKMVLPSLSDLKALDYISRLCGEKEIETISRNENKSGSSTSYNKTKVRMFSESDLRCLNDDELLILTSNKQPILSKQNTYYTEKKYTNNIKDPVKTNIKPIKRFDYKDHIEDLKIDLAIEKEDKFDIRKDLFRE